MTVDTNKPTLQTVTYSDYGPDRRIAIKSDYGETGGEVAVPYLSWYRSEDGTLSLTLDNRLGLDIPAGVNQDAIVEFIANAIAVGAGYASIYFTDRKMPFR